MHEVLSARHWRPSQCRAVTENHTQPRWNLCRGSLSNADVKALLSSWVLSFTACAFAEQVITQAVLLQVPLRCAAGCPDFLDLPGGSCNMRHSLEVILHHAAADHAASLGLLMTSEQRAALSAIR